MKAWVCVLLAVAGVAQADMLTNGDFESGNTGFHTYYQYSSPKIDVEGEYTITTSNPWAGDFGALADHTTGSGNYMAVNGDISDDRIYFWAQDVTLIAGASYTFSGFIANLTLDENLPTIVLELDNASIQGISPYELTNTAKEWNEFSFTWTPSAGGTGRLSLRETTLAQTGNDFGIDDLSLIPEPTTALLLIPGLGGMLALRRRMRGGLGRMAVAAQGGWPIQAAARSVRSAACFDLTPIEQIQRRFAKLRALLRPTSIPAGIVNRILTLMDRIEQVTARLSAGRRPVSIPAGVATSALSFMERMERASSRTGARISAAADRMADRFWNLIIR